MLRVYFGLIAAVFATTATADDTVAWAEDIDGWSVAVDRTIGNSCFLLTVFDNGQFLRFQFNNTDASLQFIVGSMDWASLEDGRDYDMKIAFDDSTPWHGAGQGYFWKDVVPSLILSMPMGEAQASHFLHEFRTMAEVRIESDGMELASLSPDGAEAAVAELMSCQATMLANAAPSDPFKTVGDATEDL